MTDGEIKWVVRGDTRIADALRGFALSAMQGLINRMSFQNISVDTYTLTLWPGILIRCQVNHNIKIIYISVSAKGKKLLEKTLTCYCDCNFAVGKIIKITKPGLDELDAVPLYTVIACHKEYIYKVYENCLASDFTKYLVGQKVVLVPYNAFDFLCYTSSVPKAVQACILKKNTNNIDVAAWRTTCRIVPWCGLPLKKWNDG